MDMYFGTAFAAFVLREQALVKLLDRAIQMRLITQSGADYLRRLP